MATSDSMRDFYLDCLTRAAGEITARRMMGEYCIYFRGRIIGDICDGRLLLKPTESALRLMPDARREYPYDGSKTLMVLVEDAENTGLLGELVRGVYADLYE